MKYPSVWPLYGIGERDANWRVILHNFPSLLPAHPGRYLLVQHVHVSEEIVDCARDGRIIMWCP